MDHVFDLDARDEAPAVLTERRIGGFLGGPLLEDGPVESHLRERERPRYVVRNKRAGVTVRDGEERESVRPDDDYQALAVVTDVRVLVVVGGADGDRTRSIPLLDVAEAGVTDEGRSNGLRVVTEDGTRYVFEAKGDLAAVAAAVDGAAQAWVRAYRLLDDAADLLDAAETRLAEGAFDDALGAVADAEDRRATAVDRLAEVGPAARATVADDAESVQRRTRELPRLVHDARASRAHESARERWQDGEYEQAHDRYETAIDAYRTAERAPGPEPLDEELAARRERAEEELAELRRVPLARAQQVARGAASIDGPAPAAEQWEAALRRFQDVLYLDWGRDERRFDGDPESVRESIVDAVDHLVTERRAAARACRDAAYDHLMAGATDAARAAYRTALDHLERAQSVADEVVPNRETGVEDTVAAVERDLAAVRDVPGGDWTDRTRAAETAVEAGSAPVEATMAYWREHGWTVEREDGDFVARCEEPLSLSAYVRVLGRPSDQAIPGSDDDGAGGTVEGTAADDGACEAYDRAVAVAVEEVSEIAAFFDASLPVVAAVGDPSTDVREYADEQGVYLQDAAVGEGRRV